MHATSPLSNFKEIEGSIFIMKTFSVLTQTMAEVSRGQEGQSSINVNSPTAEWQSFYSAREN